MIKPIKYFLWFVFESKRFTGMTYSQMIFKYGAIKRGICFARDMLEWDKAVKESGPLGAYCRLNRVVEFDCL